MFRIACLFLFLAQSSILLAQNNLSYYSNVYQIQVVEKDSDHKTAIGSGFQIDGTGHIATNYHVIAAFIDKPQKYRLKILTLDGKQENISLVNFDIINDIALLQRQGDHKNYLKLSDKISQRGDKLVALGNPYDVGITLVQGIYNGLQENSIIDRFIFSGSLNPGMSGGPALNQSGEVVGINVSRTDSQLSFLVPVAHLKKLLKYKKALNSQDFSQIQQDQILDFQRHRYQEILNTSWTQKTLGNSYIIGKIDDNITCWSNLREKKSEWPISSTIHNCLSQDSIYLKNNLTTGHLLYSFEIDKPEDDLKQYQLSQINNHVRMLPDNKAGEKDVKNWQCQETYLKLDKIISRQNKVVFCARQYKRFPKLYDTLAMIVIHGKKLHLSGHLSLAGVPQEIAMPMLDKFLSSIQWKK